MNRSITLLAVLADFKKCNTLYNEAIDEYNRLLIEAIADLKDDEFIASAPNEFGYCAAWCREKEEKEICGFFYIPYSELNSEEKDFDGTLTANNLLSLLNKISSLRCMCLHFSQVINKIVLPAETPEPGTEIINLVEAITSILTEKEGI